MPIDRILAWLVSAALLPAGTALAEPIQIRETPSPGQDGRIVLPPVDPVADTPSPPWTPQPGGDALPLTLEEAVALALRENRTIRSAYLQRVTQRFDLVAVERAFIPRGGINARIERRESGIADGEASISPFMDWRTPLGTSLRFTWQRRKPLGEGAGAASETAQISLDQPLLRGAGLRVNRAPLRVARLQERVNQLNLQGTIINTISQVVLAYRALTQAEEQVRLAELSLERAQRLLETNRAMVDAGRMAAADIVQTESAVANQEVSLLQTEQSRTSAQLALLQLLALDPRTNVRTAGAVAAEPLEIDAERAVAIALERRVDVVSQELALEQTREALAVARNDRLWDVSLFGTATWRDRDGLEAGLGDDQDFTAGLSVSIPIGDVGPEQRLVRARTNLQVAELRFQDLVQSAENQVRDAVQQVEARWRQVETARRAQALAERALQLQQGRLEAGRASNFEVLSFQADLRAADIQALNASIAYLNALTALDQQIGSTLDTWRISVED
ncbi:MAG: TolC family protein [Pseudomonadota bacterium]